MDIVIGWFVANCSKTSSQNKGHDAGGPGSDGTNAIKNLAEGWPVFSTLDPEVKPYYSLRDYLTLVGRVVFNMDREFIHHWNDSDFEWITLRTSRRVQMYSLSYWVPFVAKNDGIDKGGWWNNVQKVWIQKSAPKTMILNSTTSASMVALGYGFIWNRWLDFSGSRRLLQQIHHGTSTTRRSTIVLWDY